jgi:hypothetical protein
LSKHREELEALSDPSEVISKALQSIKYAEKAESELEEWVRHLKATVPGALYYAEMSQLDSVADDPVTGKLFPVAFTFSASMIGHNLIYYWTALMAVHAHLCYTYSFLRRLTTRLDGTGRSPLPCTCDDGHSEGPTPCPRHFYMDRLRPLGHREEWARTTAHNIAQSIEYFVLKPQFGFGPGSVLAALVLLQGFWMYAEGDFSREVAWATHMLDRIRAQGSSMDMNWKSNHAPIKFFFPRLSVIID